MADVAPNAPHPDILSLSDEASAEIASKLCGQVAKIKSSYTINENAKSSGINLMSAQAGGGRGSVGASKSFHERREALFQPRDFALLGNCQAICLPYDGVQSLPPPARLLEALLPSPRPPILDRQTDRTAMSRQDALDLLKPFLPGLEAALADPDVSEIMINGPGNVWLEGHGRLTQIDAPALDAAALERAAIHIARPLGLDPATTPILDARLDDGSRVAICVPPASPHVAITVRRFGKRSYSATQLVEQGTLPEHIRLAAERTLHTRRNILVSGGTGSGKTTLLNALIELIPGDERIVAIEDTLELRIDSPNCLRFEARGLQEGDVTIRDLVRHALRHRPITLSSAKCAAARPPTSCKPSTPATAARSPPSTPTTPRVPSRGWRAARCRAAAISRGRSPAGASSTGSQW